MQKYPFYSTKNYHQCLFYGIKIKICANFINRLLLILSHYIK